MRSHHLTRRDFVGTAAATTAGAFLAPGIARAGAGANQKVRCALIGAGSRGNQLLDAFLKRSEVDLVAVADVDDRHASQTAARIKRAKGNDPKTTRDYRELLDSKEIDAVIIATPDHWHAIPTIDACKAGKDVYCEKPVAHNVAEGQAMLKAARKHDRVLAIGTQQRSSENFRKAVEAVRSGKIGKVFWVQTWNVENISPQGMGTYPDTEPPHGVDYDRWLGPAPKRAFNPNHFHLLFRWYFDYAGGMMSDWGVHLNDIVLWALDAKAPEAVYTRGGVFTTKDDRDTPDTMQVVYEFPARGDNPPCTLTYSMRKGNGLPLDGRRYGILFCGTDGSLVLDRSGHQIIPDKIDEPYGIKLIHPDITSRKIDLKPSEFKARDDGLPDHVEDFLKCLQSRERPVADIEVAHRSTNTCHLGNIAYKLKRRLEWDEDSQSFKGDREANALLSREYRKGYELPEV